MVHVTVLKFAGVFATFTMIIILTNFCFPQNFFADFGCSTGSISIFSRETPTG